MDIKPQDVRQARQAAGMTVQQAADTVHCRYRTWQDWEHGKNPIDVARYRLFRHLTGLERLPFGTIRPASKSADDDAAELAGKIDRMLAAKPARQSRRR